MRFLSLAGVGLSLGVVIAPTWSSASPSEAGNRNANKAIQAVRTPAPPVIDGKLDDAVWAAAPPDDRFRQQYPKDGEPPTFRTEVRLLYDDDALYIGVRLHDAEPHKIVARLAKRDRFPEADWIAFAIDSRHDHATSFVFVINAAGVQVDGASSGDGEPQLEWDAVWDGAASIDAGGWNAELRIPLAVLRFTPDRVQEWGLQIQRHVSRINENDQWAYLPQGQAGGTAQMGHLRGLVGLHPRRTLELRPFVVAKARAHTDSGGAFLGTSTGAAITPEASVGLDVKIGLTSNLVLDATVLPDFGQVEADEVVLNLSRFETFLPEKRPFFLEGREQYDTIMGIFYSRRIGRGANVPSSFTGPQGETRTPIEPPLAVPILTALRLSGRLGDASIGALEAVTGPIDVTARDPIFFATRDFRFVPPMNYAAVRGKLSEGPSYLGFIGTAVTRLQGGWRDARLDHDGYAQSFDGSWQSANGRWRAAGQLTATERVGTAYQHPDGTACPRPTGADGCTPLFRSDGTRIEDGGVGYGGNINGGYAGEHWLFDSRYRALSPLFDPNDLGFNPNFNTHGWDGGFTYRELHAKGKLQEWSFGGGGTEDVTFDGVLTNFIVGVRGNLQLKSFWGARLDSYFRVAQTWDVWETGDGARLEHNPQAMINGEVHSPGTGAYVFAAGFGLNLGLVRPASNYYVWTDLVVNSVSALELELFASANWSDDVTRAWFNGPCFDDAGAICTPDTQARHYRFGQLTSGSLSFTARATWTFSPRLSLGAYAQLFLSRGEFSHYSTFDSVGPKPYIRLSDLRPDPSFIGDSDGDGKKDDDFQSTDLNLNLVLRWELFPGTTLQLVYTRAQSAAFILNGRAPGWQLSGLSTGPTDDVFLMKLTYFLG